MRGRRRIRVAGPAVFVVALLLAALTGASGAGAARPSISIIEPRSFQVVQRNATDHAGILVVGRRRGFTGPVQVRWGSGAWKTVCCSVTGTFRTRLASQPAGQATLRVRSARRHWISARRLRVGVGDIYVIAGQSNASGRSLTRTACTRRSLRASLFGNDYRWRHLTDPTDSPAGQIDVVSRDSYARGSVWPLVATELLAIDPVPVAFVPCAKGTTSISRWQRQATAPRSRSSLYGSMLRRVSAVGGRVRAVLFWQGENDARRLTPQDEYESALTKLGEDVARDLRAPLVVVQIGDYRTDWYTAAGIDAIRLAQQDTWGSANIVAGPVLYDIDLDNEVHFLDLDDMTIAARRWAAAIIHGVLGRDAATAPRLVRATYDGDRAITLTVDSGLMSLVPGPVEGFLVRAGGSEVQLAGAIVTGVDRIVITLEVPAVAPLTISLGSGRTAAGLAVPVESSSWHLPMMMFAEREVVAAAD